MQGGVYQAYSSGQQAAPPQNFSKNWEGDVKNSSSSGNRPRPSTASRAIGSSSGTKQVSSSGPGTRPSTAYGLRTSGTTSKDQHQSSSSKQQATAGQHVAGSAGRSIMRYRRTRAATDSQVEAHTNQQAWRPDSNSSSNRLPGTNGNKATLLQRKADVTPAWDRPTSSQPKTSSYQNLGTGYKYGSSGGGSAGMGGRPRPSSSGTGRR